MCFIAIFITAVCVLFPKTTMAGKQDSDRKCVVLTQDDHVDNVRVTRHASRHLHFPSRDGHEVVANIKKFAQT